MTPAQLAIEEAFRRARAELEIRTAFPDDVLAEAERIARERVPAATEGRHDRTDIEFVTIDPPGSRDLDQAVQAERLGAGYRLRYAIADVGFWVDRGSAIEREAWLRGVTYYAPDERETLYPPALSEGAASLLPGKDRPAVLFEFELDARGALVKWTLDRALVRSRAQLTYTQLLAHGSPGSPGSPGSAGTEPGAATLDLLAELGPKLLALEAERGGVSLPVRDQHVQRGAAAALGYELVYEAPNEAESWNAEVSLLTGHVAAECMLHAGVGLLRTMPPFDERDITRLRRVARVLGFAWPDGQSYAEFMHGVDPAHSRIDVLVRQARHAMRGAEYVAFEGAPPEQPLHGALAFTYTHATAPLRRLSDRYVLDLLMTISAGAKPSAAEVATLHALPEAMNAASRRENQLERRIVDLAEAWMLRDRVGQSLGAEVIDVKGHDVELQVEEPPLRATLGWGDADIPALGAKVQVRVAGVDLGTGHVTLDPSGARAAAR